MVMTREEVMRATGPTSGSKSTVKIGATRDGKIVAAQGTFYLQAARCRARRSAAPSAAAFRLTIFRTCFRWGSTFSPTLEGCGLSRAGRADRRYAVECVLDELAEALKMDLWRCG